MPPQSNSARKGNAELVAALKENAGQLTVEELLQIWDRLPPATEEAIRGTYRGTNLTPEIGGGKTSWYGKRFLSRTSVDPLLLLAAPPASSSPFSSSSSSSSSPAALTTYPKPNIAQMRTLLFRGKHVAGIIYDNVPIMDYFVQLNGDTFLGVGEQKKAEKEKERMELGPVFLLERVQEGRDVVVLGNGKGEKAKI